MHGLLRTLENRPYSVALALVLELEFVKMKYACRVLSAATFVKSSQTEFQVFLWWLRKMDSLYLVLSVSKRV